MFICILPLDNFLEGSSYDRSFYITKRGKLVYIISYRQCCDWKEKTFCVAKTGELGVREIRIYRYIYTRGICVALLTQKSLKFTIERVESRGQNLWIEEKEACRRIKIRFIARRIKCVCDCRPEFCRFSRLAFYEREWLTRISKNYFLFYRFMELSLRC